MPIREFAEGVSLALTSPTVVLGIAVVVLWWRQAHLSLKNKSKSAMDWFVMGVFIGFLGGIADNIFWGIAWTLEYLGDYRAETVFSWGAVFNVFFRQVCGTLAAYCHIRAAVENKNDDRMNRLTLVFLTNISFGFGIVFWLVLYLVR